jgi:RimJ/RimL family protein N-acetyltransferase
MISLREATEDDTDFIYKCRMDNKAVQNFLSGAIKYDEHVQWFKDALLSGSHKYYVVSERHQNVGFVRFNIEGKFWAVSIVILPEYRNKGYGAEALKKAVKKSCLPVDQIIATIKLSNPESFFMFSTVSLVLRNADQVTQ